MKPDRVSAAVVRWVRLYTAGLPRTVADRRVEEIEADIHDHVGHLRSLDISESRIGARIASRAIRGAAADATWRAREGRTARTRSNMETARPTASLTRSAARVSALVCVVLAIPLVGMTASDEVAWSIADFVLAGTLLAMTGICFEAASQRRGNLFIAGIVAILGVAAAAIGELDDAPGLVFLGVLLIAGGGALAHRVKRRPA